jgi:hypothetical protein
MSNKTFTANGILTGFTTEPNSETFVYIGTVTAAGVDASVNFDSGTITIAKLAANGSGEYVPLKTITSLADKDDKASRFILPPNQSLVAILSGAVGSPDLYVEFQSAPRSNP